MALDMAAILALREECNATRVKIPETATAWPVEEVRTFFESGGLFRSMPANKKRSQKETKLPSTVAPAAPAAFRTPSTHATTRTPDGAVTGRPKAPPPQTEQPSSVTTSAADPSPRPAEVQATRATSADASSCSEQVSSSVFSGQKCRHAVRARAAMDRILSARAHDHRTVLSLAAGVELTDAVVNRAFRQQSLLVHPDKNVTAGAVEAFERLKGAQHALLAARVEERPNSNRRREAPKPDVDRPLEDFGFGDPKGDFSFAYGEVYGDPTYLIRRLQAEGRLHNETISRKKALVPPEPEAAPVASEPLDVS
eukprot:2066501-Prymnesium_polylepis.1